MIILITKFILCLFATSLIGFIIGWILSSLIRNEQLEARIDDFKEDMISKKIDIHELKDELETKDMELTNIKKDLKETQEKLFEIGFELDEYKRNVKTIQPALQTQTIEDSNFDKSQYVHKNKYKRIQDENELLINELEELDAEKEFLLSKIDKLEDNTIKTPKTNSILEEFKRITNSQEEHHDFNLEELIKNATKKMNKR